MNIDLSKSRAWKWLCDYWPVVASITVIAALNIALILTVSQAAEECESLGGALIRGACISSTVVLN